MKTAVEWLVEHWPILESQIPERILEQAKEMEKQQIIDSWDNGQFNCGEFNNPTIVSGKQYYNETFKSE